jgi:hypothetical protein
MIEIKTGSAFDFEVDVLVHLVGAVGSNEKDDDVEFCKRYPNTTVAYFAGRQVDDFGAGVVRPIDNRDGRGPRHFIHFPGDVASNTQLDVFCSQLSDLVDAVSAVGARTVAIPLPAEEYCGVDPDSLTGMLRAAFAGHPETVVLLCTGVTPAADTYRRSTGSEDDHERKYRRLRGNILDAMLVHQQMGRTGLEEAIYSGSQKIGTVKANRETWHLGATDLFLLRDHRSGLVEHAASREEAIETLKAAAKCRSRPKTPELDALFAALGGPPEDLEVRMRELSAARRALVGERGWGRQLGSHRPEDLSFVASFGSEAVSLASMQVDVLRKWLRTKRKSQRKRLMGYL